MNKKEGKTSIDKELGFNFTLSNTYALRAQHHRNKADEYGKLFSKRLISLFIPLVYLFPLLFILLPLLLPFFLAISLPLFPQTLIEILKKLPIHTGIEGYLLTSSLLISAIGILIWLGTYYKSREREERILEEEYSHKETLVKFFEEYSSRKEISGDKEAKHILLDLHKHVIDNAAYNPSFRLGKEKSDHPTVKVINELSDNLTKVVDKTYDMSGKTSGKNNSAQLSKPNKPKKLKAK